MRCRRGPLTTGCLAAVVTLGLAGCGDGDRPAGDTGAAPFTIPVGSPSYDVEAPTWAVGPTIRVGDEVVTADPAPEAYVVTASGIYYLADGTLHFTDGGTARQVARVDSTTLVTSPDGRHLALIDAAHGPVDPYGTHVAVPVVLDLRSGEQVLRAQPGRSLEDDDLAALYPEITPTVLGVDDDAVYAVDPLQEGDSADRVRFPLDGSPPAPVTEPPLLQDATGIRGYAEQLPGGRLRWRPTFDDEGDVLLSAVLSPERDVMFVSERTGRYYDAETGEPTIVSETPFTLGGWVDDDTFYGAFSARASFEGPVGSTTIASCDLGPRPECEALDDLDLPRGSATLVFGTGRELASY